MNWREVYQLPLRSDSGSYVWSNNGTMTFTFDFDYDYGEKRKMIKKIVEKLNGNSSIKFDSDFTIQDGIDFYMLANMLFVSEDGDILQELEHFIYRMPKRLAYRMILQNGFWKHLIVKDYVTGRKRFTIERFMCKITL